MTTTIGVQPKVAIFSQISQVLITGGSALMPCSSRKFQDVCHELRTEKEHISP